VPASPWRVRIYNTLAKRVEDFSPFEPGLVKMYVCGPTVYDETHVGHARTYVAFDAFRRFLEALGYAVVHVQNITDIDDKIINKAKEAGKSWSEVADEYAKDYFEALEKLGIAPHLSPRVTQHIKDIVEFIEKLLEKGYAYVSGGSVYFDVSKYADYGRLSGRFEREAWRQEEEVLHEKKNPFDFALWKRAKPGEPSWDSPWGPGRPGWHIECSVMSTKYLGYQLDVHGGGQDLVFPHHENERAQCEALLDGRTWVKYWVHTGMLVVRGEKMSKSLGNVVPLKEVFKKYDGGVVRTWILSSHYRSQLDFSEEALEQAKKSRDRVLAAAAKVEELLEKAGHEHTLSERELSLLKELLKLRASFWESLADDFNTGRALSSVLEAVRTFHRDVEPSPKAPHLLLLKGLFDAADRIFGFSVGVGVKRPAGKEREVIEAVIRARAELRKRKMYEAADVIREELLKAGIVLVDHGLETRYYFKVG